MMDDFGFRQLDYLWLFDKEVRFSERVSFTLDDHNVTAEDFKKMRMINRRTLTAFFKNRSPHVKAADEDSDEIMDGPSADGDDCDQPECGSGVWANETLDEEIKTLLAVYENGHDTPVDIVSHLEYFYNTLECTFETKNPFDQPSNFPCL